MIFFGNKEISDIRFGEKALSTVYYGGRIVWEAIKSCFGSGYWVNHKPWINTEGWRNHP